MGLGYIVRRGLWKQGYGTECARTSIQYAFDKLGADRVIATIRPNNIGSLSVAAACGMKVVGQIVKHYRDKDMPHIVCAIDRPKPEEETPGKEETASDAKV